MILGTFLLALVVNDLKTMLLPESICLSGWLSGVLLTWFNAFLCNSEIDILIFNHLIGSSAAYLSMTAINQFGKGCTGKTVLGLGDAKLAAIGGAWLGIKGISISMAIAFLSGGLFSFTGRITSKLSPLQPFPFSPFIAFGIWSVWLLSPEWWINQWIALMGL
ncbi:A24 family peptidase [Prochlorococcus sp. MIT 1300]|uniref:prepilin peptidase n=1 Tax=Prochlorococcus sp. MIT 1300 TaxID=3096218 RepID=UPI002A754716|nr:A24 family peptidase [Prochlorococcus sp. MIT 1300]